MSDRPQTEMRKILSSSIEHGLKVPAVRAIMLAGMFSGGVGIYVLLRLAASFAGPMGQSAAYGIAGLVAALGAGAQIIGGLLDATSSSGVPASDIGSVDLAGS